MPRMAKIAKSKKFKIELNEGTWDVVTVDPDIGVFIECGSKERAERVRDFLNEMKVDIGTV